MEPDQLRSAFFQRYLYFPIREDHLVRADFSGINSSLFALCVPNIRFSMDAENRPGKFAT
jgi:hypothetical protein